MHSEHPIYVFAFLLELSIYIYIYIYIERERKEGNVLFNDALDTFYLHIYISLTVWHVIKHEHVCSEYPTNSPEFLFVPVSVLVADYQVEGH